MRLPFASNSGPTTKALTLRLDPDDDEAERTERMSVERRTELEVRRELDRVAGELFPPGSDPSNAYAEAVRAGQLVTGEKMRDVLSRALQDSADLGVSVAVRQFDNVGYGFDYTLANESARAWALRYTDDVLAQLGATTQRIVGQAVGRWIGNGEPLSSLAKDLRPAFGKQRAKLIAATEVTRAYAEGSKEAYIASGVVKKLVWQSAMDEKTCLICGGLHGKVVGIEESFDGKLPAGLRERTRPFALPPGHVGCRCWILPEIEEVKQPKERKPKQPKQPKVDPLEQATGGAVQPQRQFEPVPTLAFGDTSGDLAIPRKPIQLFADLDRELGANATPEEIRRRIDDYINANSTLQLSGSFHGMDAQEFFAGFDLGGQQLYYNKSAPVREFVTTLYDHHRAGLPLPEPLMQNTKRIIFSNRSNGDDDVSGRKYNMENFVSAATANNGDIVVYSGRTLSMRSYAHEMGHNLAEQVYGSATPPERSRYRVAAQDEPPVSSYAAVHPAEDFAESVAVFVTDPNRMAKFYPQRNAALSQILEVDAQQVRFKLSTEAMDDRLQQIYSDYRAAKIAGDTLRMQALRAEADQIKAQIAGLPVLPATIAPVEPPTRVQPQAPTATTPAMVKDEVSEHLAFNLHESTRGSFDLSLDAIARAHGDGGLGESISVEPLLEHLGGAQGAYRPRSDKRPGRIRLDRFFGLSDRANDVLIHEIGHYIDDYMDMWDSGLQREWASAIAQTPEYKNLKSKEGNNDYVDYLLDRRELWARSYTQYVATRSQDPTLLEWLQREQLHYSYKEHWKDESFEPVAKAIDGIFEKLGWRHGT